MNKYVYFFANIGNRDLGLIKEGEPVPYLGKDTNIIKESKRLLEFEEFKNLEPILIKDSIEKILRLIEGEKVLFKVFLFGTFQNPPHYQDTKYIAIIIKKLLERDFKDRISKIIIKEINKNPSDYSEMFGEYKDILKKQQEEDNRKKIDVDEIYLNITGGTPAQNFSLLLWAVSLWEDKVNVFYKLKGKKENKTEKIGKEVLRYIKLKEVANLSELFPKLAAELIKKFNLYGEDSDKEYYFLLGKHYFFLFDFDKAKEYFKKAYNLNKQESLSEIDKINNAKNKNETNSLIAKIDILFDNLIHQWKKEAYVDFLGRLFRFSEAILDVLYLHFDNRRLLLINDKNLITYLNTKKFKREGIIFPSEIEIKENKLNRKVKLFFISYFAERDEKIKEILEILDGIEFLADLRNSTIIAHGFEGVSREKILEEYSRKRKGNKDIEKTLLRDLEFLKNKIRELGKK